MAVHDSTFEDLEKFSWMIPNGEVLLAAGIEFQLLSKGRDVKHPHDILRLTAMDFIKYQLLDWELACLFNNDLPFSYRDGEMIASFYPRMQDEMTRKGELSHETRMGRFLKLQLHLGVPAYNGLKEFRKRNPKDSIEEIIRTFSYIPFFIPDGTFARGFPYSQVDFDKLVSGQGVTCANPVLI